ncbi:MAG: oligoendopeptidase F [Clostridia bacterium]|nr:oligoendopeptidase F [Clostridia bacterium]
MKTRQEIDKQYTWDLEHLYKSHLDWENELNEILSIMNTLVLKKGTITKSSLNLQEALSLMDKLGSKLERAGSYARMNFDVNMGNAQTKIDYERIDNIYTKISDNLSFYEPELAKLEPTDFEKYKTEVPELAIYSFMFENLFKEKEHILTPQEEEILSRMSSLGGSFVKIYDDMTVNDWDYPEVDGTNGEKIIANETNYRKSLNSYDRNVRKNFFKALLGTYGAHINSLTSTTYGNVKYRIHLATTRKYNSSRHMALSENHIPLKVYDSLIETVRSNVHQLQRYLDLRKHVLQYDDIHFYDLFVPLVKNIDKTYTYEESRDLVFDALGILGNDYVEVLKQAFSERWIDVYPNDGKTSGAYASGVYSVHPYSLLNFTGTLDDVFTMAHELGHVMHSYYSNKTQPYINSDYVIFTAEVASTVNEYLLYRYLLNKTNNKQERVYLLSMHLDSIRSTLYRQAFFADFEMQMHKMAEEDTPLTPNLLCKTYRELYEYYHGSNFIIDDELTYEWARIPHFYNSFYVYQYATGVSAAISLAKGILENRDSALASYLNFLTLGGSDYPINLLKKAGVDMSTSDPIIAAIQDFSSTIDLLNDSL